MTETVTYVVKSSSPLLRRFWTWKLQSENYHHNVILFCYWIQVHRFHSSLVSNCGRNFYIVVVNDSWYYNNQKVSQQLITAMVYWFRVILWGVVHCNRYLTVLVKDFAYLIREFGNFFFESTFIVLLVKWAILKFFYEQSTVTISAIFNCICGYSS